MPLPLSLSPRASSRLRRRGVTVLEATTALVVAGLALSAAVELWIALSHQQRGLARHELARQEAANVLERLLGQPWDASLTGTRDEPASAELQALLPDATVQIEVTAVDSPVVSQRVRVRIVADGPTGPETTWATLVAWKHRAGAWP